MDGDAFWWDFVGSVLAEEQHTALRPSRSIAGHVGHELVEDSRVSHGQHRGSSVVEDVGPFLAVLMCVHGGVSGSNAVGAVGKSGPFNRIVEDQRHSVAGFHAYCSKLAANSGGQVAKFLVGDVCPRHARGGDVAKRRPVAKSTDACHQHLIERPGVNAFWVVPLSVVRLLFPCQFVLLHWC